MNTTYNDNNCTMNLIIDIIRCAELDRQQYKDLMNRLILFAKNEIDLPTLHKKDCIPTLPPPPIINKKPPENLIEL